jgi:hypothetical protein
MSEYFDRPEIGLPTEFDWSVPEAELSRPLLGAIEKMSRVQRDRISNDAERVHALSDEPGQAAIYSVADDPAFLYGLANPHARSLWMFLNAKDRFRHTCRAVRGISPSGKGALRSDPGLCNNPARWRWWETRLSMSQISGTAHTHACECTATCSCKGLK